MYKLTQNGVKRLSDGADIPNDPGNRDWRKYQEWLGKKENSVEPMDVEDPWIAKRQKRNLILQASDWTQMPDAPLTEAQVAKWKTYRQKLRDLPQDYPKADKAVWPSKSGLSKV